jgi:hypothetical protein
MDQLVVALIVLKARVELADRRIFTGTQAP